jgi:hypothetical protein
VRFSSDDSQSAEEAADGAAKKKAEQLAARKDIAPTAVDGLLSVAVSRFEKEGTVINGSTYKYTIDVTPTGGGDSWQVSKRFSEFYALHSVLVFRLKDVKLPPKSISFDAAERQKMLHFYLNMVAGQWTSLSPAMKDTLKAFLGFASTNPNDAVFRLSTLPVQLYHSEKSDKLSEEVEIWEHNLGPAEKQELGSWLAKPQESVFLRNAPRRWEQFEGDETGRNTLGSQTVIGLSGIGGLMTRNFTELYFVYDEDSFSLCYFEQVRLLSNPHRIIPINLSLKHNAGKRCAIPRWRCRSTESRSHLGRAAA